MSGGRLVVLDRLGRDVKTYHLKEGLATLGSDPVCDIRFMLPTVSPHHATVAVHTKQTVVHSAAAEPTLVNGSAVSVAALRHGDEISLGGRRLRWEYADAGARRPLAPQPALARRTGRPARPRRPSGPPTRPAVAPPHRASVPAERTRASWRSGDAAPSSSGIQVAIVQPLRRDTNDQHETISKCLVKPSKRSRASRADDADDADHVHDQTDDRQETSRRWSEPAGGESATKASLWCESRRATPRRTPHKIHDPPRIDHTKQAAIMLMTGHTPKNRSPKVRASLVVKRASPVRKTPRRYKSLSKLTPGRTGRRSTGTHSISILEIGSGSRRFDVSSRSHPKSSLSSPILGNPKKSALKDPRIKKVTRKTESIKFDLSNLEVGHERSSDGFLVNETVNQLTNDNGSDDNLTLHYSESSAALSPSPRKTSRSSKILEKSLGTSISYSTIEQSTLTPRESPRPTKSIRGSVILKKALENSRSESRLSRSSKIFSDQSFATVRSDRKSRSPRMSDVESYSVVDLISLDSNDTKSVYDSAGSTVNSITFNSPQIAARRTRAGQPSLIGSSTPYSKTEKKILISDISNENNKSDKSKHCSRKSTSLTTPENTESSILFNSTKIKKVSKSRSRINDSDVLLLDEDEDASPRSSRRGRVGGPTPRKNISVAVENDSPLNGNGTVTPENEHSPKEASTPILSIQTLLDESQKTSPSTTLNLTRNSKRKTLGDMRSIKSPITSIKSKSFSFDHRYTRRGRDDFGSYSKDEETVVTPRSAVKLVHEAVKNKHSTAKKPQSKRSIIDNLDNSEIVKHLFNSPVKRNLSQSMTKLLHWQDEDGSPIRPTRHTVAFTGRTPDNSILDRSTLIEPEVFVSPLDASSDSSVLSRVKRLFRKETPENDLRDVRGVKNMLRTPRVRKSIKNDLTNVSGVKKVFARSPKNRLSDVRLKEMFASSPKNDLRCVHGVKALFKSVKSREITSPDVRGVRSLFKGSPKNDLGDISGVKTLKRRSPKNDLRSVTGVKELFREEKQHGLSDLSGVEELFEEPPDLNKTFDQLLGKPRTKSYGKSKSLTTASIQRQKRSAKSLHDSIDSITNNVEEWLQKEIKRRVHKPVGSKSLKPNKSILKSNLTKELQKLTTDTVEGNAPLRLSRVRNSTMVKSTREDSTLKQRSLPIKKRSITETSLNRSNNTKLLRLPIKKRALVHSTPVKGRVDITMNTTELGRMSPIASIEQASQNVTDITAAPLKELTTIKKKGKNVVNNRLPEIKEPIQSSQRRTRNANVKPTTPIQPRVKRGRKVAEPKLATVLKKRKSITITKKPPILSPKPAKQITDNKLASKRQTRATRIMKGEEPVITPPKNRTKSRRASLVISKSTPNLNPKSDNQRVTKTSRLTRKTKGSSNVIVNEVHKKNDKTVEIPEKITRARRNQHVNVKFIEMEIKSKEARKTQEVSTKEKNNQDSTLKQISKRSRRTLVTTIPDGPSKDKVMEVQGGKRSRTSQKKSNITDPAENTKELVLEPVTRRKGRKTVIIDKIIENATKRGRPVRDTHNSSEVSKRVASRGAKGDPSIPHLTPNKPMQEERKGRRSKKVTITQEIEVVAIKKRPEKSVSNQSVLEKPQPGGKVTRQTSRSTVASEMEVKPKRTRAKRVTQSSSTSTSTSATTNSRKRKSTEDVKAVPPTAKRRKLPASTAASGPSLKSQAETRSSGRSRRR